MVARDSFISSLDDVSDVNDHYAFIDRNARDGNRDALKQIFNELCKARLHSRIPDWAAEAVLERIIEALALTGGYDNATSAIELTGVVAARVKTGSPRLRLPAVVSRIVAAHGPDVVDALLHNCSDVETSALVLHEAIARRKLSPESTSGPQVQARLANTNHPLAVLPLMLFALERDVLLPKYGIGSSGTGIPFGPTHEHSAVIPSSVAANVEIAETTSLERANLISAAVRNWKEESNGQIEARTFRAPASGSNTLANTLRSFGLECLAGTDVIQVLENGAAKEAFTLLFSAASSGGAYNCGNYAAYGRLFAWRSLAGLVGASIDVALQDIATISQSCQWCLFGAASEWYYQVAWDIGIACWNPDQREIAVLAATDTD